MKVDADPEAIGDAGDEYPGGGGANRPTARQRTRTGDANRVRRLPEPFSYWTLPRVSLPSGDTPWGRSLRMLLRALAAIAISAVIVLLFVMGWRLFAMGWSHHYSG